MNDNDSLDLRDISLGNYSREPTLMHHYFRLNEYMKARSVKYRQGGADAGKNKAVVHSLHDRSCRLCGTLLAWRVHFPFFFFFTCMNDKVVVMNNGDDDGDSD